MGNRLDRDMEIASNLDKATVSNAWSSFWDRAAYVASTNRVFINDKRYNQYKTLRESANASPSDMGLDI